jgi:apolipoprotein N-acyltransferase
LLDWLLVAASGALTALAFPRPGWSWLAWVSLLPLFFVLTRHGPRKSFSLCFFSGFVFNAVLLHWIPAVPAHYGNLPSWFSVLIYLLLAGVLGLFWGLFGFLFARVKIRYPRLAFLLAPFIWVGVEYLLTFFLTGFPWGLLGYSQSGNLPLMQAATLAGVFGISFLIVLFQSLLILAWKLKLKAPLLAALGLVAAAHGAGWLALRQVRPTPQSFTAGVIQGNVPSDLNWGRMDDADIQALFQRHVELTRRAHKQGAVLVAWPELSVPLCFSCPDRFYARFKDELVHLARSTGSVLLLGSTETSPGPAEPLYFNSALCLAPRGPVSQYNKMHLVPFGEYTPYPWALSWVNRLTSAIGRLTPGRDYVLHRFRDMRFGSPICYEIVFPDLVRRFVKSGADFLVTITNDGWYGQSWGPDQHFAIAAFRAVENRRFVLRAATTGISGVIDPYGRVVARSELLTEAVLTAGVTPNRGQTFYTRNGDLLPLAGLTLGLIFFILSLSARPDERQKRDESRPII